MADNNTELRSDVQHGLDDNPHNDAEKAAALGGLGGAAVGAAAGSAVGPVGTLVGAIAGGLLGAGASGLAVGAVDQVDNDNTVSGIGDGTTSADVDPLIASPEPYGNENIRMSHDTTVSETGIGGHNVVTGEAATSNAGNTGLAAGAIAGGLLGTAVGGPVGAVVGGTLGALAGGVAGDAVEAADDEAVLGDSTAPPALAADEDWNANREAIEDINRSNAIPLGASTADALSTGEVSARNQVSNDSRVSYGDADFDSESSLLSAPQTDYRAVDEGLASIGATDTNADLATVDEPGTPGVRSSNFDIETQAHRTTLETDAWDEDFKLAEPNNDAPGIHPENMTTAGAINGREQATDHFLAGDDRDEKARGTFNNSAAHGTDVTSGTEAGDYERGVRNTDETEHPATGTSR